MQDRYETTYQIFNHEFPPSDRPLALVAMHWSEDATTGSTLYERIEQFESREVYKRFGLSMTEFLDLPTDICLKILEICAKRQSEAGTIAQSVLKDLGG